MKSSKFWVPVIISLAATPICLLLGIASAGAGHGSYFLAKILFPFTLLSAVVLDSITVPFILVAVAQFPLYGAILGAANVKGIFILSSVTLLIIHITATAACFLIDGGNF